MAAYYKVDVSLNTNAVEVGLPSPQTVNVTIPLVGPAGPQGPAGEAGAGAVESVNGQTGVVVLAAADVGAVASNDARLTDARTPTSHTHGNLSNAGAIGTTANLPVKTGTSGVLEAGAFGTSAGQFAEGNHTHAPASLGAAQAVTVIELTPSPGSTTITTSQLPARGIAFIEGGGSFTVNLPTPDKRESGLTFSIKVEHEGASGAVFITVVHNASDLLTSYELDEDESSLDFLWDGYRWTYSSANWLYSYPNRRLVIPPLSGTLGLSEPSDSTFRIVGSSDATKKVAFEVDGLTTATVRTLTVPDASGRIQIEGQAIGNTTAAAATFTTLTANTSLTLNGTGAAELVNGTSAAGPLQIYRTTANANADYERGFFRWGGTSSNTLLIGTEKLGTGAARALEFQTDGVTRVTISSTGTLTTSGAIVSGSFIRIPATQSLQWLNRGTMYGTADGVLAVTNFNQDNFGRLCFGGTTSSFPSIKRDTTTLQARLADDSAFTAIQGKLTTETAYTAGAPTATGYLVVYDSNGTAYKVPAEAL
jgi:hypothetical protein